MNLLNLVQRFTTRTGIAKPASIIGNTDSQVIQLLALVDECLEDLVQRNTWSALEQEALFNTVLGEDQGLITTLAPNGFKWILLDTIYNRTMRLPIFGPINPTDWQALKALPNAGPYNKYRIVRGHLMFNPPSATAGQQCAFEYASTWAMLALDGVTTKQYPSADTDTFLLDDTLILACLRWKWKYEKGLDYAEDFARYEELVTNAKSRDASKAILSMSGQSQRITPGIFVPAAGVVM